MNFLPAYFIKCTMQNIRCRLLKVLEKKLKKTEGFATRSGFPNGVRRKSHPIRLPHLQTRGKWLNIRIFVLSENILIILQNVYFMNGISNRRVKMQAAENLQGRREAAERRTKIFCSADGLSVFQIVLNSCGYVLKRVHGMSYNVLE